MCPIGRPLCADIYIEHRPEPDVLADTLMHHMLMPTATTHIGRVGSDRKILIREHAPGADHFDALRLIGPTIFRVRGTIENRD